MIFIVHICTQTEQLVIKLKAEIQIMKCVSLGHFFKWLNITNGNKRTLLKTPFTTTLTIRHLTV